jgi:hypothetical protein
MNRIPEKLRNMGCKVKMKQCFTDYVSYLSTQYFVIFLEYGSCPVKPLLNFNSELGNVKKYIKASFNMKESNSSPTGP